MKTNENQEKKNHQDGYKKAGRKGRRIIRKNREKKGIGRSRKGAAGGERI